MTARFHLQPLLDLAQTRTDEAARKLGELVAAERDLEQKLKMLEEYREEYNERFVQYLRDGHARGRALVLASGAGACSGCGMCGRGRTASFTC